MTDTSSLDSSIYSLKLLTQDRDAYEEQGDIMNKISCEILDWLETFFCVGIEMEIQFDPVHKSLTAIQSTIEDIRVARCRLALFPFAVPLFIPGLC